LFFLLKDLHIDFKTNLGSNFLRSNSMVRKIMLTVLGLTLWSWVPYSSAESKESRPAAPYGPKVEPKLEKKHKDKVKSNKTPKVKETKEVKAAKLGLIDLAEKTTIRIVHNKFAHPALVHLMKDMAARGFLIESINEAWPTTSKHASPGHSNGKAIDVGIDEKLATRACHYVNSLEHYKCINEYKESTEWKTGSHLHLEYLGK
jgi:hypothetical protein